MDDSIVVGSDVDSIQSNGRIDQKSEAVNPSNNHSLEKGAGPPISAASTKGFGLKKWRRIPRKDHVEMETVDKDRDRDRDSDSDSTTSRMLKRGSANILNENTSAPSLNSNNEATINAGAASDTHAHSHRTSSKSSTAASAPKHGVRASHRDKNRVKNSNQLPKTQSQSQADPSKKAKAGSGSGNNYLNFDKESSPISSFESDSRSCNSVFNPPSLDHFQTHTPNLDGEDASAPLPATANFSDQGKSKDDYQRNGDRDPLVDSILMLQSAQLALQAEIQKFGDIGKGICSLYDDSDKTTGVAVDAVVYMAHGSMCDGCNDNGHLSKSVQTLERQLNEAECSLKEKEQRIVELETSMKSMESPQDHVKSAMEEQYKRCTEMEAELQVLFRQKLEAEVQSVVMTRSSKDLSFFVEGHSLSSKEKAQSPRMMVDVENKAGQTEKSDTLYTGENIQEMRRGVNKLSKCFGIQLLLLVVIITLFVLQLAPKPAVVVPT